MQLATEEGKETEIWRRGFAKEGLGGDMLQHCLLAAGLLFLSLSRNCCRGDEQPPIAECEGKKIAILDLSDLSGIGDFPKCHLDEVNPS